MAIERAFLILYVPAIVEALSASTATMLEVLMRRTTLWLLAIGLGVAVVAAVGAPWIIYLLAPGFDPERAHLAVSVLRVFAFVVPASILVSLATSLLNALRRFGVPELIGQFPRIAMIVTLWLLVPPLGASGLTWSLLVGTVLAALVLIPSMIRAIRSDGDAFAAKWKAQRDREQTNTTKLVEPGNRIRIGHRLLPMLVAQGHMQGAIWIDVAFASTLGVGFLSILEYGQRLTNMAPSILSNSLLAVAYTELSHKAAANEKTELNREAAWTFRTQLFLTLPIGLFLSVTADLIVSILLHRGAFGSDAAAATAEVIRWLVPALVVNTMASTLNAAVFADSTLPHFRILTIASIAGLASRVALFTALIGPLKVLAIPLGTALSMGVLSLVMLFYLRRYRGRIFAADDLWAIAGIFFCGAVSAAAMLATDHWLHLQFPDSLLGELGLAAAIGIAGAISYLGGAYLIRQQELVVIGAKLHRHARDAA
jgi:putative peptidoglycan lipid II flippase